MPLPKVKRLPLAQVNPEGRLDVVAYRLSQILAEKLESKMNMQLWPSISGYVEDIINEVIPAERVQLPEEVRVLMNILRRNGLQL